MYTIIGNGRVARHMVCYFSYLNLPYLHWHRGLNVSPDPYLKAATHVLLLLSDKAIDEFILTHQALLKTQTLVHFSAALMTDRAYSVHPLMTFNEKLLASTEYSQIPFVLNAEDPGFNYLLPGLPNPFFTIPRAKKTYYHALCVMANNFSTLLWQRFFSELQCTLDMPAKAGTVFLEQTFNNLRNNYKNALTGPLIRNDHFTIEKNLQALTDDPFLGVYQAFVTAYQQTNSKEK